MYIDVSMLCGFALSRIDSIVANCECIHSSFDVEENVWFQIGQNRYTALLKMYLVKFYSLLLYYRLFIIMYMYSHYSCLAKSFCSMLHSLLLFNNQSLKAEVFLCIDANGSTLKLQNVLCFCPPLT